MVSQKETTNKGIGVNSSLTSGQYMPESSSSNQIIKVNVLNNNTNTYYGDHGSFSNVSEAIIAAETDTPIIIPKDQNARNMIVDIPGVQIPDLADNDGK